MKKAISAAMILITVMGLTSCKNHPVNKVEKLTDNYAVEHYTVAFPEYSNVESETYYVAWEGGLFSSPGPTEPGYRAVVTLEEDAEEIFSEYEWTAVEDPQFTLELIEVPQSEEWYMCKQFEKDSFQSVNVNYLYYNGTDTMVFDIHTT